MKKEYEALECKMLNFEADEKIETIVAIGNIHVTPMHTTIGAWFWDVFSRLFRWFF